MKRTRSTPTAAGVIRGGAALAMFSYAAYAGLTWLRYGHPKRASGAEMDPLLDRFMPIYDVVERHHIRVAAPPAVTLAAAKEQNLFRTGPVRAIFKARQLMLGSASVASPEAGSLLEEVQAIGWRILAEVPDREIVFGAVTKPWNANVTFRGISPEDFAAFSEADYVKIAWTLRADSTDSGSIFRTETRAVATDADARRKFRRYWSFVSPGVASIRWLSLRPLKRAAERQAPGATGYPG